MNDVSLKNSVCDGPLVSVCITTYNRKDYILSAINSILKQSYNNFELIIVDDASSDGTEEFVRNNVLNLDQRISYFRHDTNKGLAAARNSAIKLAKGKYFSFCDDDDVWLENYISTFVEHASTFPENFAFCCGNVKYERGRKLEIIMDFNIIPLFDAIKVGFTPPVAAQFYQVADLNKIDGYNEDILSGVDHDLWLRLAFAGVNLSNVKVGLSVPNRDASLERMTTNYEKRSTRIQRSLEIWKGEITEYYGENFYDAFCREYKYYIFSGFFIKYMRCKKFNYAFKFLFKHFEWDFVKRLTVQFIKQLRRNGNSIFTDRVTVPPVFNMEQYKK